VTNTALDSIVIGDIFHYNTQYETDQTAVGTSVLVLGIGITRGQASIIGCWILGALLGIVLTLTLVKVRWAALTLTPC